MLLFLTWTAEGTMKEREIRERINDFLRETMRTVVVPASMGLGLVLGGCSDSSTDSRDGSADVPNASLTSTVTDTGAVGLYSAPMSDTTKATSTATSSLTQPGGATTKTATDSSTTSRTAVFTNPVPDYAAPFPDAGASTKTSTASRTAVLTDPVTDYAAPLPDAGVRTKTVTSTELGPQPLYAAPQPETGLATATATSSLTYGNKYGAPVSSTSWATNTQTGPVLLYMAPIPALPAADDEK